MTLVRTTIAVLATLAAGAAVAEPAARPWYKQPWEAARVRPCDRACLVGVIDGYLNALETKDRSGLALAEEVWFTENTARLDLGEGSLWRREIRPTSFRIVAADPAAGQVAVQTVLLIEGKPALVAVRLKVERRMISEAEHLIDPNVAPEAMALLASPRPGMVEDVPPTQRASRELMVWAANAYFDALTGEDGRIAPFDPECVRHEQGYRTVNNKTPGRYAPTPALPPPDSPLGRFSMMSCEQQLSTGIFNFIKRIWPRRVLIVDEQKGLVATFPMFIEDGTKRPVTPNDYANNKVPGTMLNMVTMETFSIRNNRIRDVEAFPFVTFQYGLGDGWTPARAR